MDTVNDDGQFNVFFPGVLCKGRLYFTFAILIRGEKESAVINLFGHVFSVYFKLSEGLSLARCDADLYRCFRKVLVILHIIGKAVSICEGNC